MWLPAAVHVLLAAAAVGSGDTCGAAHGEGCAERDLLDRVMHGLAPPEWLDTTGHPLALAYHDSVAMARAKAVDASGTTTMTGFERVTRLLEPRDRVAPARLAEVRQEILEFLAQDRTPAARLGDSLRHTGSKQSYHLRLFGTPTQYGAHLPLSQKLLDEIADEIGAEVVGISLGILQPFTWLRYHEGFWGYAQYVTRAILGVEGADSGAAVHVWDTPPSPVQPGRVTTFDDCKMHQAWNSAPTRRIALIFDMQLKGGILRPGVAGVTAVIERVTGIAKEDHEAKERQRVTVGTAHTVIAAMS